jgi:dCMP deaminase
MLQSQKGFDNLDRPSWDLYFMNLAFAVSLRSLDPRTKCGSVFVSADDYSILVTGYNSPPSGYDDENVPLNASDDPCVESKYDYFSHSEESGIALAAKNGVALKNSILYVNARPCHKCLRKVINAGVKEIVYADTRPVCVDDKSIQISKKMLQKGTISYREFKYNEGLLELNNRMMDYMRIKNVIKS